MIDVSDKAVQEALHTLLCYDDPGVHPEAAALVCCHATLKARIEADTKVIEAAKALAADYKAIIDAIKSVPALLPNTSREARFTPEMDAFCAALAAIEQEEAE